MEKPDTETDSHTNMDTFTNALSDRITDTPYPDAEPVTYSSYNTNSDGYPDAKPLAFLDAEPDT